VTAAAKVTGTQPVDKPASSREVRPSAGGKDVEGDKARDNDEDGDEEDEDEEEDDEDDKRKDGKKVRKK